MLCQVSSSRGSRRSTNAPPLTFWHPVPGVLFQPDANRRFPLRFDAPATVWQPSRLRWKEGLHAEHAAHPARDASL